MEADKKKEQTKYAKLHWTKQEEYVILLPKGFLFKRGKSQEEDKWQM